MATVKEYMKEEVKKRRTARTKKAVKDVLSGKTGNKAGLANQKDMDHANSQCQYGNCKHK